MTLQLKVPNMACSACGETITKAIRAVDPTATVQESVIDYYEKIKLLSYFF